MRYLVKTRLFSLKWDKHILIEIWDLYHLDHSNTYILILSKHTLLAYFPIILLSFWNTFFLETHIYAEWVCGCYDRFTNNLMLSGNCTSLEKAWWNKRWLLTPPISWHSSLSPRVPFHRDICKLSSPINSCLFWCYRCPPNSDSEKLWCTVSSSATGESIKSQCWCKKAVTVADEWWSKSPLNNTQEIPIAMYIPYLTSYLVLSLTSHDSSADILQSLNSISGSKSLSLSLG